MLFLDHADAAVVTLAVEVSISYNIRSKLYSALLQCIYYILAKFIGIIFDIVSFVPHKCRCFNWFAFSNVFITSLMHEQVTRDTCRLHR